MKFLINSFSLLLTTSVLANLVVVDFPIEQSNNAKLIKSILATKFYLPKDLISLRSIDGVCSLSHSAIIQICLNKDGEFIEKKFDAQRYKYTLSHLISLPEIDMGN